MKLSTGKTFKIYRLTNGEGNSIEYGKSLLCWMISKNGLRSLKNRLGHLQSKNLQSMNMETLSIKSR